MASQAVYVRLTGYHSPVGPVRKLREMIFFIYFYFKYLLMFIFERERECEWWRWGERERDTKSEAGSRLRAVSTEPDAGFELTSCEIVT